MAEINAHYIQVTTIARNALRQLDELVDSEIKTLFVLDIEKLVGTLTDGDIRRGLLRGLEISEGVSLYMNKSFRSLKRADVNPEKLSFYRKQDIWLLPILNDNTEIEGFINLKEVQTVIPAAALLMAGGRGERLRPLTDTVPKPMLKVGDKPIIEINIDRLIKFGFKRFYISVRYLSEKIIEHLGDGSAKKISITYLLEDEPLGTMGACSLIGKLDEEHLLVMNADILTNIDFEDLYNNYKTTNALMCAASIPYDVKVPYGIMQTNGNDKVTKLVEKPTYTYYANAGIYLMNKILLSRIPANTFYNATDMMQELIDQASGLVHYPILGYWLDIGKYEDFARAQQDYKHISFL